MEQTATQNQINLFAENLPSLDEIKQLAIFVNSSETNQITLAEQVEANLSSTSTKTLLIVGIGLYILGKNADAIVKLQKAKDCKEKFIYLAFALRNLGKYDEAIESLKKSLEHQADQLGISLEKVATYRLACNFEAAAKELKGLRKL